MDLYELFKAQPAAKSGLISWVLKNTRARSTENLITLTSFFLKNGGMVSFFIVGGDSEDPVLICLYFEPCDGGYMMWAKPLINSVIDNHYRKWRFELEEQGNSAQLDEMKRIVKQLFNSGPVRANFNGVGVMETDLPYLHETPQFIEF